MVAPPYNGRMRADIHPLQFLLMTVSGWVNRQQTDVISYLLEENRVLKEQFKGRLSLPKTLCTPESPAPGPVSAPL